MSPTEVSLRHRPLAARSASLMRKATLDQADKSKLCLFLSAG